MKVIETLNRLDLSKCVNGECLDCLFYTLDDTSCNEVFHNLLDKIPGEYKYLEDNNEKLCKIINILCDTINQLIE